MFYFDILVSGVVSTAISPYVWALLYLLFMMRMRHSVDEFGAFVLWALVLLAGCLVGVWAENAGWSEHRQMSQEDYVVMIVFALVVPLLIGMVLAGVARMTSTHQ